MHFAVGGTGRIVDGLAGLIGSQGNQVRYNTRVAPITTTGRRADGIRLDSGEHIAAHLVVSNADSTVIYGSLGRPPCCVAGPTEKLPAPNIR